MKKLLFYLTIAAALLPLREASADPTLPTPVTASVVADPTTGVLKWPTVVIPGYGTVAAPAFTFANDTDTGLYRVQNNTLGFASGGVEAARLDAGQLVLGVNCSIGFGGTGASATLTNLGGTTVGKNLFKLTNPDDVRFLRINADNTVTARTAAEMISTDLGGATLTGAEALTNKTYNGLTLTTSTGTITITNGKTLALSNTLTFTGTDGSAVAFGTGGTVAYTANKLSAFAGTTSAEMAGVVSDENGTGALLFSGATSPDFTTSVTTSSATFTAWSGATTLLTIGGTGASASLFAPSTLDTTSSTTGAIRTSGGISCAKAANIGTTLTVGTNVSLASASTLNWSTDAGIIRSAANVLKVTNGSSGYGIIDAVNFRISGFDLAVANQGIMMRTGFPNMFLGDTATIKWNNSGTHDGYYSYTQDIGLARDSAGMLRITDGSSGTGALKAGTTTIGSSGTAMTAILSTSATLDFPNIAADGGTQDLTITVTGAATGNVVSIGLPAAPNAGVVFNAFVSAADTVTVRATNTTAAGIDPASASYRVMLTKF